MSDEPAAKKRMGGGLIIAVISIGAAYVAYSMYVQFDEHSNNNFGSVSGEATPSQAAPLKAKDNAYQVAMLAMPAASDQIGISEATVEALQDKVGNLNLEVMMSQSNFLNEEALKLIKELEKSYLSGDTTGGLAKVAPALAFCKTRPDLSKTVELDILLLAVKLAYKAKQLDLARSYVSQAIGTSRLYQDYKMDQFACLDCILKGDLSVAEQYQSAMSHYKEFVVSGNFAQLPAAAAALQKVVAGLPADNFFRLNADVCRAAALYLGEKKGKEAQALLISTQKTANEAKDLRLVSISNGLYRVAGAPLTNQPRPGKQL